MRTEMKNRLLRQEATKKEKLKRLKDLKKIHDKERLNQKNKGPIVEK